MPEPQVELEQTPEIVPGTDGTDMEGMSEDEIGQAMYKKELAADPDSEDPPPKVVEPEPDPPPDPAAEIQPQPAEAGFLTPEGTDDKTPEADPKAVSAEPETKPEPTGLEWLDTLAEEDQAKAKKFLERQSQTIAVKEQIANSHLGQLQPAQHAITMLRKQVRDLEGKLVEAQPSINIEDRIKDYNNWIDVEFKEFPEEATKLKTRHRESLDGLSKVLETATPPPTVMAGPDQAEETQHLATAYSDWGERRFSPEFDQWISRQAPELTALLNSAYASDNVALLNAFTRDNPDWVAPQSADQFHSLRQAQHSLLFRGWAEGEGINPDVNVAKMPDFQRDMILTRFKADLSAVQAEQAPNDGATSKRAERRREQLENRDPGSRRAGIKPGHKLDLNTEEGKEALYRQLVAADPDD